MDATQTATTNTSNPADTPKLKPHRRIKKLTAAEIGAFPGAIAPHEKTVEPDFAYFISSHLPVTGCFGTPNEAAQVHDFAYRLDTQAKAKGVGAVTSVSVANGLFDVVLTLSVTGEQASYGAPASNAFTLLKEYLSAAPQLHQGTAEKQATWKAKVNGTTILEGRY